MQQVILDVTWLKGFFGDSGASWSVTVPARTWVARFLTRASHNFSAAALPTSAQTLNSKLKIKKKTDFTACLQSVQQKPNPLPCPPPSWT